MVRLSLRNARLSVTLLIAITGCGARTDLRIRLPASADAAIDAGDAARDTPAPLDARDAPNTNDAADRPSPRVRTEIVLADRCADESRILAVRFDPDTGTREELFPMPSDLAVGPNSLAASPDGLRFTWAGVQSFADSQWRIYVQDGTIGPARALMFDGLTRNDSPEDPAFSPDNSQLAFSLALGGTRTIGFAPPTDGPVRSMRTARTIRHPAWSPDGRWLVMTGSPESGPLFVSEAPFEVVTPLATVSNATNAVFTYDGLVATVESTREGRALVLRRVPSGEVVERTVISDVPTALWLDELAAEPNGDRFVLMVRSMLFLLERGSRGKRALYVPENCMATHAGLTWVVRPD